MQANYYISSTYFKILLRANPAARDIIRTAINRDIDELIREDFIYSQEIDRVFAQFHQYGLESWLLEFGEQLNIASHGPIGFAVLSAPDLQTAMNVLADYTIIRSSAYRCEFQHAANRAEFILHDQCSNTLAGRWIVESGLRIAQQLIETIMAHPSGDNVTIAFTYPEPNYSRELESYYGVPCEYNAPKNSISIPASWCQINSPLSDDAAFRSNLIKCREQKLSLAGSDKLVETVRLKLSQYFDSRINQSDEDLDIPSLSYLAMTSNMSPRTFTRRLKNQGSSYKTLLEDVRREYSLNLLAKTHMSIADIAYKLAYQEPANFIRAFKKWFKLTPSAWRRKTH